MSSDSRSTVQARASSVALPARRTGDDEQEPGPSYAALSRVMGRLQALLSPAFGQRFWVRAELGQAGERDGTFRGDLVEVNQSGVVIAKVHCAILSRDLQRIRARFAEAGLELVLQRGTMIGVQCTVQFHPVHGLSLLICDMDPSFVLGELELRRRRILTSLEREGLLGRNAHCALPIFPKRILLITSRTGAALQDFTRTLQGRKFGVQLWLADATMQGPTTESSVLRALALTNKLPVDLVVVIRGGGSKLDLGWLDSEALARAIAALRRPVWTGIGHETDTSVLDHVAARSFRTPTAVAEALAAHFEDLLRRLDDSEARMRRAYAATMQLRLERMDRAAHTLQRAPARLIEVRGAELDGRRATLVLHARARVAAERAQLTLQQRSLKERALRHLAHAQAALSASARETGTRTAAAIARARFALAPKTQQIQAAFKMRAQLTSARIAALRDKLTRSAGRQLQQSREHLTHAAEQFTEELVSARCQRERQLLEAHGRVLRASDPRRALELGYSITYSEDGTLVRSTTKLAPGARVTTHVSDGSFEAVVQTVEEKDA